jgi:Heterokaryon incompatibility protein (HET)
LNLPPWRWKIEHDDPATLLQEWNNTMEAIGIDTAECPLIPRPIHLTMNDTPRPKTPTLQQELNLTPRFQWGDFEAISYCWESEVREKKIIVNSTVFEVPKNLEALLQRLEQLPDAKSGMKFWVDALCINQGDVKEKNHQVQLMQSIYTKAFAVIIWLGEAGEESEKAIEFISSINCFTLGDEESNWESTQEGHHLRDLTAALPWKPLLDFFSRGYWRRLWIIQELALNHNMSLFLCGKHQLSRSMILRTSGFYQRHSILIDGLISRSLNYSLVSRKTKHARLCTTT